MTSHSASLLLLLPFASFSLLAMAVFAGDAAGEESPLHVYVSVSGEKRLAHYELDTKTGALTAKKGIELKGAPGAQTVSSDKRMLYVADRGNNGVDALRIDPATGNLTIAGSTTVVGNPVYVSLDGTGRHLLTAYYTGDKAAIFPILKDGTVGEKASSVVETKKNPHSILIDRENRTVYVPDCGSDMIQQYRFDAEHGTLKPHETPEVATAKGDGPRHVWLHPKLPVVYFVNEKSSSVSAYRRDKTGSLSLLQNVSTLPEDFQGGNTCADIELSAGGEFLYASNRGHDSIAAFRVDAKDGRLTPIGRFATEQTPRSFNLAPGGRFLVAAGQGNGRLAVYRVDPKSGELKRLETYDVGKSPAWVQIVER